MTVTLPLLLTLLSLLNTFFLIISQVIRLHEPCLLSLKIPGILQLQYGMIQTISEMFEGIRELIVTLTDIPLNVL